MGVIGYGYGSEWDLLWYLGRHRRELELHVMRLTSATAVEWSDFPDDTDDGLRDREWKGLEFLRADDPVRVAWEQAWPHGGNVQNWDALARLEIGDRSEWLLVEAKAHTGELISSCAAASPISRDKIASVFEITKAALGVYLEHDWTREYYQFSNRVALLHHLTSHGAAARLLFVYFIGDRADLGTTTRECPANEAAWAAALARQEEHVGIPNTHPLNRRIHKLFLPAYRVRVASDTNIAVAPATTAARRPTKSLEAAFSETMFDVYRRSKDEAKYNPARFLQMLNEHGGVETARRLLPTMSEGFAELWKRKRLDLTVEYVVLQPRWESLFSEPERAIARQRLRECGMELKE